MKYFQPEEKSRSSGYSDYEPITYWGGRPVYVTTLITAALTFGLLLGTIGVIGHWGGIGRFFLFSPSLAWSGMEIWRPFLYPFYSEPSFFVVFGLFCIYSWGQQVELYLGRRRTIGFYLLMLLVPVLVQTFFWLLGEVSFAIGGYYLCVSTLIAFCTLYPNLEMWGTIRLKWVGWICFGLAAIQPLSERDMPGLFTLCAVSAAAFGYIRWLQLGAPVPRLKVAGLFRRKPALRVLPDPVRPMASSNPPSLDSVDAILEKILKHGIKSLTQKEKDILEKERLELLSRDPKK